MIINRQSVKNFAARCIRSKAKYNDERWYQSQYIVLKITHIYWFSWDTFNILDNNQNIRISVFISVASIKVKINL